MLIFLPHLCRCVMKCSASLLVQSMQDLLFEIKFLLGVKKTPNLAKMGSLSIMVFCRLERTLDDSE